MARTLWRGIALAVAAGAAVAVFRPWASPAAPATTTTTGTSGPAARTTSSAAAAPEAAASPALPPSAAQPAPPPADEARRIAGYDRYRAELQRIRAAREQAQALQANERCIAGQRFRKRGTEWEQAGGC